MELLWNDYKYYPYEKELALREVQSLLAPSSIKPIKHGIKLTSPQCCSASERLVYFQRSIVDGVSKSTVQSELERVGGSGFKKQSTRYSVHGLHEYKGKFNPQMARVILNILNVPDGARVLDPFCGSGTSLVECAHMGMEAVGTDINPLAVFLANAKLKALRTPATSLKKELEQISEIINEATVPQELEVDSERLNYLKSWFETKVLTDIETLRYVIASISTDPDILMAVASNLLREYSLQEPMDLRIRRRKSPPPTTPFFDAFMQAANTFVSRLQETQALLHNTVNREIAVVADSREIKLGSDEIGGRPFDCALTSPPYATALPYIDTQRLSLVWLGLLQPSLIMPLESKLVGSREASVGAKKALLADLLMNREGLPTVQAKYCLNMQEALGKEDGFRRQAVPRLLYRYFAGMAKTFVAVSNCVRTGGHFALIVGSNHTTLGGKRFDIDTPRHLAELAEASGWTHQESIPLQTYQRYGLHHGNAVTSESLIILKKP